MDDDGDRVREELLAVMRFVLDLRCLFAMRPLPVRWNISGVRDEDRFGVQDPLQEARG